MRERVSTAMCETIHDDSENAAQEKAGDTIEAEEDENNYYSEIKDFLLLEKEGNDKEITEWGTKKWGENAPKWLGIIRKRAAHYLLLNGILHHGRENPKPVITEKSERLGILHELHVQECTGVHVGVSKMYSALCAAYFWRGQYGDVKNFVRSCGNCMELPSNTKTSSYIPIMNSTVSPKSIRKSSNLTSVRGTTQLGKNKRCIENRAQNKNHGVRDDHEMWKKVEINVLGPYDRENQCIRYVVVIVDPFSKWISAQPLLLIGTHEDITGPTITYAFSIFCTFGFPKVVSIVEESGLKLDTVKQLLGKFLKRFKFAPTQSSGSHSKIAPNSNSGNQCTNSHSSPSNNGSCEEAEETLVSVELTSSSSCTWAWDLLKTYVRENEDTWALGLDAFLFEERVKVSSSTNESPFYLMFGRQPFQKDSNTAVVDHEREQRPRRRKLRSSVFECRHCQECFTSKISFHIHQKKHTEEAQIRGLIEEEIDEDGNLSSSELPAPGQELISDNLNASSENVSLTSCQKSVNRPTTGINLRRKPVKVGIRRHYQRGITRLLTLAQVSKSLVSKEVSDEIPRDSHRASFTAQTVASVRASLEAKRKKHICRGNYQRYTPELREEIAKYALIHGTQQAVLHFSSNLGGKRISESTVRNFMKAHCSTPNQLSFFRSQGLEEEIGRFSAIAGTEAAVRHFSNLLGLEVKRGIVFRLRRAYISKHPEVMNVSKVSDKKKSDFTHRKKFTPMLRDEIGSYAAQHGVSAAVQHYSERLLFTVRERTVTKFLKMYMEKESSKNSLISVNQAPNAIEKTACLPNHTSQSIDILSPSLDVLSSLNQSNTIERLDQGASVSQLIYGEDAYDGLQHTLNQEPTTENMNTVGFHTNCPTGYSDDQHPANQVIIDQSIPVSFCSPQDINFSTVQNYTNFEPSGLQVSISSVGVVQSSEPITMDIQQSHSDQSVGRVPISHVISQNGAVVVSTNSVTSSHNNSINLQSSHPQLMITPGDINQEQLPLQTCQTLSSSHTNTLTSVIPSSFDPSKHHGISSSLISHSTGSSMSESAITSLHKSMLREIDPSYYPSPLETPPSFQIEESSVNGSVQNNIMNKSHADTVSLNSQSLILSDSLLPITLHSSKDGPIDIPEVTVDTEKNKCLNEIVIEENCLEIDRGANNGNNDKNDSDKCANESLGEPEQTVRNAEEMKNNSGGRKSAQVKKSKKKVTQKPKRGNYTFYSPELRARIGRYAAEHGNLQAAKYFETEVGHLIPESTIRGLRDKYVVKQMQVAATAVSSGDVQKQVTALGYAPRGRPMRLGKYDEIVQDCMHELVKSGEKVSSMLAIATARQVLTQYEPSLLEEYGGPIKLNNSWAKSFLKRMGLSSSS